MEHSLSAMMLTSQKKGKSQRSGPLKPCSLDLGRKESLRSESSVEGESEPGQENEGRLRL